MNSALGNPYWSNFLGASPDWYKKTIIAFLIVNPILLYTAGPFVTGWVLIGQFIFTLALALQCYPLQPGGLLAIEAVAIGLAEPQTVFHEAEANFEVILLLMFMVAGSNEVVRVNGRAKLTTDANLRADFERKGRRPETVIVIKITEVYIQCSRALLRSGLWACSEPQDLPTMSEIIAEASNGKAGGQEFDRAWPGRAVKILW